MRDGTSGSPGVTAAGAQGRFRARCAADGPDVLYGGELVATFGIEIGGELVSPYALPWGNGTLVYRVDSPDAANDLLNNPALTEFRRGTTDDLLAVLEMGQIDG